MTIHQNTRAREQTRLQRTHSRTTRLCLFSREHRRNLSSFFVFVMLLFLISFWTVMYAERYFVSENDPTWMKVLKTTGAVLFIFFVADQTCSTIA